MNESVKDLPPSYDEAVNCSPSAPILEFPMYPNSPNYPRQCLLDLSGRSLESPSTSFYQPQDSTYTAPPNNALALMPTATLTTYPDFNPKDDVQRLHNALTSGPDRDTIVEILCHRTMAQRMQIIQLYDKTTFRSLIKDIKSKTYFNFYILLCGLATPYYEFMARCIHRGKSFRWLYYILFTIPNHEIIYMKQYFETKYKRTLEKFIPSSISNDDSSEQILIKPLLRLLEARRNESNLVNPQEVEYDVRRLEGIPSYTFFSPQKNEKEIIKDIFYYKSFNHIRQVCAGYTKGTRKSIFDCIKKCYSGEEADVYENIARYAVNKDFYFAYLLKLSMKGWGTNDMLLIHILNRRSEIDLGDIKTEFVAMCRKSLRDVIKAHTSGHYKYGLYALMGEKRTKK